MTDPMSPAGTTFIAPEDQPNSSSVPQSDERRRLSIVVDYLFGRGVASALPRDGLRLVYSRRSGRVKLAYHREHLFATVKPGGAVALSIYGAELLARSPRFRENCIIVADGTEEFVRSGRSVFCKFVVSAGANITPKCEVVILDTRGAILGVGTAVMSGKFMKQFKSGAAVKIRTGRKP